MTSNNLKITFRNMFRKGSWNLLNIAGLAIGITCAALIFLWVEDETSYNSVHLKKDQLYFATVNMKTEGKIFTHNSTPGPMAPVLKAQLPGVKEVCRMTEGITTALFTIGNNALYADGRFAEPSAFSMFTLPFVEGNAATAFSQLHSLVITERTAIKFFGTTQQVTGKTVRMNNKQDYVIGGVVKDIPANSSISFEWLAPFQIFADENPGVKKWDNFNINTYVELAPEANADQVNKLLAQFVKQRDPEGNSSIFLFGMKDWRLYDQFENGVQTGGGRITYVRLFSFIAWIILLIACINFMNLSTARSEKKSKEVGVRKVLGAGRYGLIGQFFSETILMSFIAAILAILLVTMLLPAFNTLVQKDLSVSLNKPNHLISLLLVSVVCGLVAGSYPSFYLSSFNPIAVFKGTGKRQGSAAFIRKGLVVLQFSVSIILIICTVIVYQQIEHARNRELGFERKKLIAMDVQGDMVKHFDAIDHDLRSTGLISNTALSDHNTLTAGNNTTGFSWEGKSPDKKVLISVRVVTPDFINTSGMKLAEGRTFENAPSDTLNAVITASFAKLMGGNSAIGKIIYDDNVPVLRVIGVVNDYVYGNIYSNSDPVLFVCNKTYANAVMYMRMSENADEQRTLATIGAVMKKHNPGYPVYFRFVDDQFNAMLGSELLIGKLSRIFASLAILISCLGLFGLAAFTAERRTKEIGVRKVMGASITGITTLLSKDFLKLVIIAAVVAFPVAWYAMQQWLQQFNYRVTMQAWVFVAAGVLAVIIALLTISFQSVRAARMNPVKSLRNE